MTRRLVALFSFVVAALVLLPAAGVAGDGHRMNQLSAIKHIVVIYEENHSFDNLYGGWEGVNGRANADAVHTRQVDQAGAAFACLKQNDVNLTSPPLAATCTDTPHGISSAFTNTWFAIDPLIPATAKT